MTTPTALMVFPPHESDRNGERETRQACLQRMIAHAAHLLPAQGPITVFIHHNTLHAFEDMSFTDAVEKAAKIFGCQPYLTKDRYRAELERGRIQLADLEAVLREDLGARGDESLPCHCTRRELRLAMLQYPLRYGPTEELLWFVAETGALRRVRPDASAAVRGRLIAETRRWVMRDLRGRYEIGRNGNGLARLSDRRHGTALSELIERFGEARIEEWNADTWEACTLHLLWRICRTGVAAVPACTLPQPSPVRHRDLLLQVTGEDTDLLVHELLIPFCAAFLDQGLAHWQLPRRDEGFYRAFQSLYQLSGGPPDGWRHWLAQELRRLEVEQVPPLASIHESLTLLGVPEKEWDDFLAATLLALRGWGGMIRFLEEHPDRVVHPVPPESLIGFLAIRLVLERLALQYTAQKALSFTGSLSSLRDELHKRMDFSRSHSVEQRAFPVFQLAQVLGWTPEELHRLDQKDWSVLVNEIEAFSTIERRRIFHRAYERRFRTQTLDALAVHNRTPRQEPRQPRFQALFCIDEREESIRRHIEELAPDAVTLGIAGFYFLAMYYRGVTDAHFVPLCPIVIKPQHWVVERVVENLDEAHGRHRKTRRALGKASHQIHIGSRTLAVGAFLSAALGVLASVPLVARTLFPRFTARIRKAFSRIILAPPPTRLQLERTELIPGSENSLVGYTLDEMTDIAERVLRDTGLTSGFARLVLTFGHGSNSMNNPHESAHDCGACGGARGGPNGRAIAHILNDHRVRKRLKERGLHVPPDTVFVGGMHNTSSAVITFYDLDRLPPSHRQEFEAVRALIEQACDRDAHERCRRFESAPLTLSFAEARRHVEGRAEDLAQVRPEWGHATNAICIVGRRQRTRGLFLDRRAFLNSYDPTQDDAEATILTRILQAALPVCAGISLEYYFSYVDNTGYGCGTKLPHNITALLGVMDGAASDLRTGLPWQMVEIHEPVRILFVIETTPETMRRIMDQNPAIDKLIRNDWIQLATLNPTSPTIHVYQDGSFHEYQPQTEQLPRAASSVDWYRGWRDHLEFAQIGE
ncbi:MAG: DUF2309 domain-containing protein [Gemmataceae bacterium]